MPWFVIQVCALFLAIGLASLPAVAAEVLSNEHWRVELDPATLGIRVQPTGQSSVQVSQGVDPHPVRRLEKTGEQLSWQWSDGAWTLQARLLRRELLLTINARDPGVLTLLNQPGSAMGNALIWPLAEGHYVPRGHAVWQQFLADQGALNTTQDLSLPLWGMDHGAFTLTWWLSHPYNNHLQLSPNGDALSLSARHTFTSLDSQTPMTLRLSLGDADPLAGARRYRQWLIENGRYQTLEQKFAMTPEGRKLPGASHVYLWGTDLLGQNDVRSWPRLLEALRSSAPLAVRLRGSMDAEAEAILSKPSGVLQRWEQAIVLRSLNQSLNTVAREGWRDPAQPDMHRLATIYGEVRADVAELFGDALVSAPAAWGGTLTVKTINRLREAGLSRLWLGLGEGWEGGLWHPEAVRAAVNAGYLIAPYDSYETALAPAENPDWVTAHLGSSAHRDCAIVVENGGLKSGFQQSGHYTDPRCVRPLREARINAVQAVAGFNSWFLDAYGTGMVFDSYRTGATLTQAQNADENQAASRWIAEVLGLPAGSEDGNAVTAGGVLFAHGMQTPVIGWGDHAMSRNSESPWFVGRWYPREQPEVFFKPVPLQAPYRTVHFDPTTRLPLYQTVFHGAVVTSHHWLFDSLKLPDVSIQNQLSQLLYNVPPLYHLSEATQARRLKSIQRQDAFFRPLHERLATQAMTGFHWLTHDRQVQQTTFADGTRLVANFDDKTREVGFQAYKAHSVTVLEVGGSTQVFQP